MLILVKGRYEVVPSIKRNGVRTCATVHHLCINEYQKVCDFLNLYNSYIIMVSEDQFCNGFPHFLGVVLKEWYTMVLSQISNVMDVTSGVPQGSLLFLIYINDLPDCISSSCSLFADDCLLYRTVHSKADREALHQDLESLHEWANKWLMTFNINKCEVL